MRPLASTVTHHGTNVLNVPPACIGKSHDLRCCTFEVGNPVRVNYRPFTSRCLIDTRRRLHAKLILLSSKRRLVRLQFIDNPNDTRKRHRYEQ